MAGIDLEFIGITLITGLAEYGSCEGQMFFVYSHPGVHARNLYSVYNKPTTTITIRTQYAPGILSPFGSSPPQ